MQSKRCPKCSLKNTLTLFDGEKQWVCGECGWVTDLEENGLGYRQEIKEREEREKQKAMEAESGQ